MTADTHGHAAPKHPYHLVDPSPWPAVGAASAGTMFMGAVLYMHPDMLGKGLEGLLKSLGAWTIVPGLIGLLFTFWVWWRDVINEATFKGNHTPVVQLHHRYGMVLFIASEVMFF
ncbi:MAG: cytochrome c oxidase subunit 3, partial [Alphaproteobacteria bacterium]|nr:cytochrome c oxidase subunit 3 [Alphaproteobacteria bacterium]